MREIAKIIVRDKGRCAELERCYIQFMMDMGFDQGKTTPCVFFNKERDLRVTVHGDDFIILYYIMNRHRNRILLTVQQ